MWRAGFVGCVLITVGCANVRGGGSWHRPLEGSGGYVDPERGAYLVGARGVHIELPAGTRGVLFGDVAVVHDRDAAGPMQLYDTKTKRTIKLSPDWTEAMVLGTQTSQRHRPGARRLVASCTVDGLGLVVRRLDVDAAFAVGRDTTVTSAPIAVEGGVDGECAFSTDTTRLAVLDATGSQLTIVALDDDAPPRRLSNAYDRVAFAGAETLVASSELGVELIAARTGTVTQVLLPGGIEITGPGVTYRRGYSRVTMQFSGDPVLIDEHGRLVERRR